MRLPFRGSFFIRKMGQWIVFISENAEGGSIFDRSEPVFQKSVWW